MYPRFLQLMIRKQVGDLSTHTTKYTSPALTHKVFANMMRVGKGFYGVDTPLFEGMLVDQQVADEGDIARDVSAAHGEVPTIVEEPSIPSPTPPTPPPQPPQDIPLTSQVQPTPPQSPQVQPPSPQPQPQPQQDAGFPMNLLQEVMDTFKKLERRNKVRVLKLSRLQRVGTSQRVETSNDTVMDNVVDEAKEVFKDAKVDENVDIQGRQAKSQSEIYKIDLDHANKVLSMQDDETEPTKVQEVVEVVTTAKLIIEVVTAASETITAASANITAVEAQVLAATLTAALARVFAAPSRRRKGVVIKDLQKESTTSTIIPAETKSKDKVIDHVKLKAKEDPAVKKYQALKRKPQTEAQARKNMMLYLKNVVGFKMDYFKGMSYDDIRPIFEAKFNSNLNETPAERAAKRQKLNEEVEELKRHLQIVPNEDDDVYTEATPLARKVPVVDYQIIELNNKPYYKIIRADDTQQLYVSFLSLLRNFNREDLEALWSLVKERFSTTKPKNFSDDFFLVTLEAMFEKQDIHAQIWKNQRTVHGPAKVKGWKLLESCGVQIITFTSTQLILLVERKYLLTRFTLDQMLNAVRLKVEEESEVSLELLRCLHNVSTKRAKHNLESTYLWHCRLVHISKKRIENLQKEGLLSSTDDESFDQCVSCLWGKMTRKSFPHRPERATDLLGIILIDVCGPLRHVSRQGYPHETMGYYFYFPPENKIVVARYAEFFEKNLITQEGSRMAIDLEEIQDEDTSPSKITSKIPMEVEGLEPPQEEVILVRKSERTHRAATRLCLNVEVKEHS
nr:retrotransposon protein, putative, Ty1-copia subclass [Tanacetum cinerariifolium]